MSQRQRRDHGWNEPGVVEGERADGDAESGDRELDAEAGG